MRFLTEIPFKKELDINHHHGILLLGSCFTENIGRRLEACHFRVSCNPLGILFNPVSIQQTIERILEDRKVTEEEVVETDGVWNSFDFHSQFAKCSLSEYLSNINQQIELAHQFIKNTDFVFITLGTAWVYEENESHHIVANCHKVPANRFTRKRISESECTERLKTIVNRLKAVNEKMNIIFTVSPIRHWKDGAHGNQLSKSILLLSVDNVCRDMQNCHYFPSYELMMDELRDYRFYADDMLHPSEQAQAYIWEKFGDTYFSEETQQINKEVLSLEQALHHRPINPDSESFKRFQEETQKKKQILVQKYPFLHF